MQKQKVALLFVCLNPSYWPYLKDIIEDARKHFLPGHEVSFFVWSDMPELGSEEFQKVLEAHHPEEIIHGFLKKDFFDLCKRESTKNIFECHQLWNTELPQKMDEINKMTSRERIKDAVEYLRSQKDLTIYPTDSVEWPFPTLMRYHLFLQQDEVLKDFDYIFYIDSDMRIVDTVGEEILGQGLTIAEHPMYSLARHLIPPFEPNPQSACYVPRLGCIIQFPTEAPRFKPLYAAGGFQGGKSDLFIEAMKEMRKMIDHDLHIGYTPIWNDESAWNKYLSEYKGPLNVLTPSYVYPDSLIKEYYEKIWGCSYQPKIVTLTKKFSVTSKAGSELKQILS